MSARWPISRSMAAVRSSCFSGAVTHSFTPARNASSISVGSRTEVTMMTPICGCFRRKPASSSGRPGCSLRSTINTSSLSMDGSSILARSTGSALAPLPRTSPSSSSSFVSARPALTVTFTPPISVSACPGFSFAIRACGPLVLSLAGKRGSIDKPRTLKLRGQVFLRRVCRRLIRRKRRPRPAPAAGQAWA